MAAGEIPKETEISGAETLRTKATLSRFLPGLETDARLRKAATPRHFRRSPGKSSFAETAWWRRQLIATGLGKPNSLLTGKLTGNFAKMPLARASSSRKGRADSMPCEPIPCSQEQGIVCDGSANFVCRAGKLLTRNRELPTASKSAYHWDRQALLRVMWAARITTMVRQSVYSCGRPVLQILHDQQKQAMHGRYDDRSKHTSAV